MKRRLFLKSIIGISIIPVITKATIFDVKPEIGAYEVSQRIKEAEEMTVSEVLQRQEEYYLKMAERFINPPYVISVNGSFRKINEGITPNLFPKRIELS